jgi:TonB family protein
MLGVLVGLVAALPRLISVPAAPVDRPATVPRHGEAVSGFTVTVSPSGEVVDCQLQATSFYPGLDAKGCAALQSAHLAPATDPQGAAVYGAVDVEVTWPQGVATVGAAYPDVELSLDRMPAGVTGRPIADLVLAVDRAGAVGACQVVGSTGSAALDSVACSTGVRAAGVKAVTSKDGSPQPSVRALRVRFVVLPHYGVNKPPRREIANVYPDPAQRMGVTGFAVVRCEPDSDGVLKHCSVAEEGPPGAGFGRAGVNIIQVGQVRVTPDQQGEVFVPVGFYLKPCPKPPDKWFSVCGNRYPKGY